MSRREERKVRAAQRTRRRILSLGVGGFLGLAALWGIRQLVVGGGVAGGPAISRLTTADFHSLAFSAASPDTVFFGHHGGLKVSRDGGRTWQDATLRNADAMALAAPASNPNVMYAAGHNVFFRSEDGGRTWTEVQSNLPGLDIHAFAADPENGEVVYAFVVGFGLFRSEDGGTTWGLRSPSVSPVGLAVGETLDIVYAAAGDFGVARSDDGGRTWERTGGPRGAALAIAFDGAGGRLYVSVTGDRPGLYVSEDSGATWLALDLTGTFVAIAVSPLDPDRLVVVDQAGWVYASRDGGKTWTDS